MTFGEKLKNARTQAGYSQEQLAEKLCVSRSAVAKWETDKGMPDIENLKAAAKLLSVSIDDLLDDESVLSMKTVKEAIDLEQFTKTGKCRSKQDAAVAAKFPQAKQIYVLTRKKKLSKFEHLLEWTVMPSFGLFEAADQVEHNECCYLVDTETRQYMVIVSKEFIEITEMTKHITDKKFTIGSNRFSRLYTLL
jgi:transcriptional regulator with XRE-family HTH domain